jgi:hypothetical protein
MATLPKHTGVMRQIVLLLGTLALTDCAAQTVYLRTDGKDIASDSALRQQLDRDRLLCEGDTDCMATKGYVSVRKDQVVAKQQQLATIAAENAAAIAVLPPPTLTRPQKTAIKKQKSNPPENVLRSSQDWLPLGGQAAHHRRGAADRGEYRQAALSYRRRHIT